MKLLTSWPVPVFLAILFAVLISTSNASTAGTLAALFGLSLVLILWGAFRELSAHAEISRALSIGDSAGATKLADAQLGRRRGKRRGPFFIYRAMAHELGGRWQQALQDLDEAKPREPRGGAASWRLAAACLRVSAWCELGQVPAARQLFDAEVAPRLATPGDAGSLLAQLALGRLLLAEGELGGAERQLTPLSRNVRLGPAQRAQAFHYLAQVARQAGDAEAAARLQAQAAALAPGSVFASAMAPTLASATATATATAPAAATLADAAAPLG